MKKLVSLLSAAAVIGTAGSFPSFAAGETHHVRMSCGNNISYDVGYSISDDDFEFLDGSSTKMPFGDTNESDMPAKMTFVSAVRNNASDTGSANNMTVYESDWGDFKDDILIMGEASIVNDTDILMVSNNNEGLEEPAKTDLSAFMMHRVVLAEKTDMMIIGLTDKCFSCQPNRSSVFLMDDNTMRIHMNVGKEKFSFCTDNDIVLRPNDDGGWDAYAYLKDQGREKKIVKGDVNCDGAIDAADASAVLEAYALISTGKEDYAFVCERFADYNGDGSINASDASAILEYYAKVSTSSK